VELGPWVLSFLTFVRRKNFSREILLSEGGLRGQWQPDPAFILGVNRTHEGFSLQYCNAPLI